ncbi:MAG: hypothetical protein WBA42_05145 [Mesorhizobium sp.]
MNRERLYLFDITLRGPSARSRVACEDGQNKKIAVASWSAKL